MVLIHCDLDNDHQPQGSKVVAVHMPHQPELSPEALPEATLHPGEYPAIHAAYDGPTSLRFVDNVATDRDWETQSEPERKLLSALRISALVVVPLKIAHQWQGLLWFGWAEPQAFDDEKRALYTEMSVGVAAVVAALRTKQAIHQANERLETLALINAVL